MNNIKQYTKLSQGLQKCLFQTNGCHRTHEATYQIEEILGHMSHHTRVCGPKDVLGGVWPTFIFLVCLQIIDKLKLQQEMKQFSF